MRKRRQPWNKEKRSKKVLKLLICAFVCLYIFFFPVILRIMTIFILLVNVHTVCSDFCILCFTLQVLLSNCYQWLMSGIEPTTLDCSEERKSNQN